MKDKPILIVMLTYNDRTVENAAEIFEQCKDSEAQYWGFKEEPLPPGEMKKLYAYMKQCGKTVCLEVVAYDEKSCVEGARLAVECEVDVLMGTMYFDSVRDICRENGIKYVPFVGEVTERPSVLGGSIEGMIEEAHELKSKGVDGIDLLGYRYTGDAFELNRRFVAEAGLPVGVAGSVNSFERLDDILEISPWAFTIGSAFFEKRFGDDFCEQINTVCRYISDGGAKC